MKGNEQMRVELSKILADDCPLKSVLKVGRPCPYYGPSGSCSDCSYHWQITVGSILEGAGIKRMSHVRLKEQLDEARNRIIEMEKERAIWLELVGDVVSGVKALLSLKRMAMGVFANVFNGECIIVECEKENEDGNGDCNLPGVRKEGSCPSGASD